MKYEIVTCIQCGDEFKRTNPKQQYCSGACRVSAHRDRHGYEQPIFKYPSIRSVEAMKNMDVDDLYRIKLYAMCYLKDLQEKGEAVPPSESKMNIQRMIFQLSMELEKEDVAVINKAVEPLTHLILSVRKIQEDAQQKQ